VTWPANVWHGTAPADPVDPDARAALLEAELPGLRVLMASGAWPLRRTVEQAERDFEGAAADPFYYIAKQERREARADKDDNAP